MAVSSGVLCLLLEIAAKLAILIANHRIIKIRYNFNLQTCTQPWQHYLKKALIEKFMRIKQKNKTYMIFFLLIWVPTPSGIRSGSFTKDNINIELDRSSFANAWHGHHLAWCFGTLEISVGQQCSVLQAPPLLFQSFRLTTYLSRVKRCSSRWLSWTKITSISFELLQLVFVC